MTKTLFKYSKKILAIDKNYIDWLIDYFRRQNQTEKSLETGYFNIVSSNLNHIDQKKYSLSFYNFFPLVKLKQLLQKFFGSNSILLFNLKSSVL